MDLNKLIVPETKLDLNYKFYCNLKYLVKTKLTKKQAEDLLTQLTKPIPDGDRLDVLSRYQDELKGVKLENYKLLSESISSDIELRILIFSLRLYLIKDLLRAKAAAIDTINNDEKSELHPLSLRYDKLSVGGPYLARVKGALLALLLFEQLEEGRTSLLSQSTQNDVYPLPEEATYLKGKGIELNQIFMLMFSESINQSIISNSGSNYEDRIYKVLIDIGINAESIERRIHDSSDTSTEYDLRFDFDGRSYGISAKRTLRERYKQSIKTTVASNIDVKIEITIGQDLTEGIAQNIIKHGSAIFVAGEFYLDKPFLQDLDGVFSVEDLSIETLKKL